MPRAGVSAPGREGPQSSTLVVGKTARQVPKSLLSLSTSSFLAGSLTSLVYGEQSEKTSPSDISLEMEHRDKVGPGGLVRGGRGWAHWHGGNGAGAGALALDRRPGLAQDAPARRQGPQHALGQPDLGQTPQPCQACFPSGNTET